MSAVRKPDTTRQRLLDTAIELFRHHGYNGTSVRDIAAAVGVSAPALYRHFPNKRALYQAAVAAAFEDKAQRLLDALHADSPPIERLAGFVGVAATELRHSPAFRCLLDRELLDGDEARLAFLGEAVFARVQQPFMCLLDELRPGCDAFLLSEMILGMLKQHDAMLPLHPYLGPAAETRRGPEAIAGQVMAVLRPYFAEE